MTPVRLNTEFKEKVWGATGLSPWYPDSPKKIGEAWFTAAQPLPLLVKFIFTSAKLSVQVHPDDHYAALHENSRGKTEMWHVLRADPHARLALGFREAIPKERLREASVSGEIERLLEWHDVKPGDTFFVPAGTVHAIGAGLVICEIQQPSDVTYRLFDYGRRRELHLDHGVAMSDLKPHPGKQRVERQADGSVLLAECRHFRAELIDVEREYELRSPEGRSEILVAIEGSGRVATEYFRAGEAFLIPQEAATYSVHADDRARFIRTWAP